MEQMLAGLRTLPQPEPPREVTVSLRILGSREALRRRRFASPAAFWKYVREGVMVRFDNLLRPVAMPAAGGVAASMLLFAMIAPALTVNRAPANDVLAAFSTEAQLESSFSVNLTAVDLVVVDLFIDEQGKVVDYSIPEGQNWAKNPMLVRNLETTLLYTKFTPATYFGQPSAARTRITLLRSQVEVRG
jgi:hypothetical protein